MNNNESTLEIDARGNKRWYLNDELHREDGPAVELNDGHKSWWLNGERHRISGPAIEYNDGTKAWFLNGYRHSQDEWFQALTPEQQNNYLWSLDE
jgi:hypothetical protein